MKLIMRLLTIFYFVKRNMLFLLKGKKTRLWFAGEDNIFLAKDETVALYFCRLMHRRLYKKGIAYRLSGIFNKYHLNLIDVPFSGGGVLIDCGANVGELGFEARKIGLDYIAFEPEALEARCCDLNNYGGERKTHRKALWKETTKLTFYSKPNRGDGSAIPMGNEDARFEVDAVTLDDAVDLSDTQGIVILKIEAEGAEPEVLRGAENTLPQVDWVSVNCDYERGIAQDHTFTEVNDFLLKHHFRLRHADLKRGTFLYQNQNKTTPTP